MCSVLLPLEDAICTFTRLSVCSVLLQSTFVLSQSGKAVVIATGRATYIASLARVLPSGHLMNAFDYAIRRIVYLFITFIVIQVPLVIVCNGLTTCKSVPQCNTLHPGRGQGCPVVSCIPCQ